MPKKQDPEEPIERPVARVKGRRPRRQKAKRQITVRIDENIVDIALARATEEGLRLTDAVEEGLVGWLKSRRKSANAVRLRFLCNHMPKHLEHAVLAFTAWYAYPRENPMEEEFRKAFDRAMLLFQQSPDYEACLNKLGTSPKEEDDSSDSLVQAAG